MNTQKFKVGDLVERIHGPRFPSVVILAGTKLDGEWLYVIEASHPMFRGATDQCGADELQRRSVQPVMHGQVAA